MFGWYFTFISWNKTVGLKSSAALQRQLQSVTNIRLASPTAAYDTVNVISAGQKHTWCSMLNPPERDSVFPCLPEMQQSAAADLPACSAAAGSGCWSSSLWWALTEGKLGSPPALPLNTDRNRKHGASHDWQNGLQTFLKLNLRSGCSLRPLTANHFCLTLYSSIIIIIYSQIKNL